MVTIITRQVYIKFPVSQGLTLTLAIHITIFDSRILRTVQSWINGKHAVVGLFSLTQGFLWGVDGRSYTMRSHLYSFHQLIIDVLPRKASFPDMLNSITKL